MVLKSFIGHKRANSDGSALPSSVSTPTHVYLTGGESKAGNNMGPPGSRVPRALEELQQNQLDAVPSPYMKSPPKTPRDKSPSKAGFTSVSLKSFVVKDSSKLVKSRDASPAKPKKTKSSTNLAGLLSRPRSSKNLRQKVTEDEEAAKAGGDKENRTPQSFVAIDMPPPPIYARFARQNSECQVDVVTPPHVRATDSLALAGDLGLKQRPKSYQPYSFRPDIGKTKEGSSAIPATGEENKKRQTWAKFGTASRPHVGNAFSGLGPRPKSTTSLAADPTMDSAAIEKHLEALLDRRNIPENQRYKMRNLNDTIKLEFIRQDWAETKAKTDRPHTNGSDTSSEKAAVCRNSSEDDEEAKKKAKKQGRGRSWTLSRDKNKNSDRSKSSGAHKSHKGENTLGRHFRAKSTESVASDRSLSTTSASTSHSGFLAKAKGYQSGGDFVAYLRKVQKPEAVEVGKLHKLRLLLRNETVAWTDDFIRQGGMKEIVDLLHRIMKVEWREEHEDNLLHENLLCVKALCTTGLAMQYLHSMHATLFPALLHMIFDAEKKGPSEFTTRGIITFILLKYMEEAVPQERVTRAATVLRMLRDPEPKEEERPVSFVLDMRRQRPYSVWCKEVVNVTKEVFWIFLHHLNVIALPSEATTSASTRTKAVTEPEKSTTATNDPHGQFAYMARHFPQERAPVAAAPYVGGVEWDATNYMASQLDLLNAVIACTPTPAARNALRAELRLSGWERCLGSTLRLCKEKFYGAVHDALRTWVAAAHADGWDVRPVRFGPPPSEQAKSARARSASPAKKKAVDPPPRLEMPELNLALDSAKARIMPCANEPWLS